jgi:hypothetical protein
MASLAIYRRSLAPPTATPYDSANLPPLSDLGIDAETAPNKASKGSGWSRWWRRAPVAEPVPIGEKTEPTAAVGDKREATLEQAKPVAEEGERPASDGLTVSPVSLAEVPEEQS